MVLKFYLIVAGLVLLRLLNLNQSLWLDEAITVQKAKTLSYGELVSKYSVADFHPPGHYFVVKAFGDAIGYNETVVRLPSLLACVVATIFIYKLGGKWASILFLANPLIFYYSQEARMYMLSVAMLTGAWYAVSKDKWWANILAALSLVTFYGSGFFLVALLLTYRKNWKRLLPGMLVATLMLSPLVIMQLGNSRIMLALIKNWGLVLGRAEVKNLGLIVIKFFTGRVSFYPKIVYFILGGAWAGLGFSLGFIKSKKGLIVWPIAMAFVVSFWAPMLQYFRFLYLIPVLCMGLAKYGQKIKFTFLLVSIIWCGVYIINPSQWREDWRGLAQSLPSGATIALPLNFSDPINYYRKDLRPVDIRNDLTLPVVYSTNYGTDIIGIDYDKRMTKLGYRKLEEKNFNQIKLDTWKKD